MLTNKEILTREEVMEFLKIGRSTFYRLLQTGELKGFKEGNRYKVPVESVEKYVEMKMRARTQSEKKFLKHLEVPHFLSSKFCTFPQKRCGRY